MVFTMPEISACGDAAILGAGNHDVAERSVPRHKHGRDGPGAVELLRSPCSEGPLPPLS